PGRHLLTDQPRDRLRRRAPRSPASANVSTGHQTARTGGSAAPTAYSLDGTPARSADDGTAAVPSPGRSP
ncbi:hypothetical protein, partial [Streptomyces shenzhenensis]|uniref:hypothetical protein n=1 Tax=Streptomyces shenzhenensis TaxID=943815 RepID=UPI001C6915E9